MRPINLDLLSLEDGAVCFYLLSLDNVADMFRFIEKNGADIFRFIEP